MAQPIVIQLQELASDSSHDINDLLRKGLMVAKKLDLKEFREWIVAELNGYAGGGEPVPGYRVVHGDLRVENPFHGPQPFLVPSELHDHVTKIKVGESVASIQQLIEGSKKGHLVYYFPPDLEKTLMSMQDSLAPMRPLRVIGANKLIAILNTVRTRMLEWALSLEEEGILGNGLSFSASEKQAAMQSQNIRIENFQGVLGDVVGGSVTQTNAQHIAASDFSSLARHLLARGIHQADIGELEQAVRDDPEPASGKRFGPRVSAWMGKMVGKAASGSWDVTVATAGGVLASALSKFYGFG